MRFFKMDNSTKRLFEVVDDDLDEVLSLRARSLFLRRPRGEGIILYVVASLMKANCLIHCVVLFLFHCLTLVANLGDIFIFMKSVLPFFVSIPLLIHWRCKASRETFSFEIQEVVNIRYKPEVS